MTEPVTHYTDAEVSKLIHLMMNTNKWSHSIIEGKTFTESQMDLIVSSNAALSAKFIRQMADRPELTDRHVDTILSHGLWMLALAIFDLRYSLTPSQIEFGLRHEYPIIYEAAYKHPCCTEEQRVWYHLTKG